MSANTVDGQTLSAGYLVGRIVFGLLMSVHGSQKLFGWFGGHGLRTTGEFMVQLGFRPGRAFAFAAGLGEFTSGLLIALGFLGPIGPALMISVMIVAIYTVLWHNGLLAMTNGIELPLLYIIGAIIFAVVGYGAYSLDAALGLAWPASLTWIAIGAGIFGGVANAALRHRNTPAGV